MARTEGAVVIGVGNAGRGDDAAGLAVARRLRGALPAGAALFERSGEPAGLLACLEGAESAWLIDACASGGTAGAVRRLDAAAGPLPAQGLAFSSHGLGLAEAIELARALDQLPRRCVVYAIEGAGFELEAPLSPAVEAATREVADRVRAEVLEEIGRGDREHA